MAVKDGEGVGSGLLDSWVTVELTDESELNILELDRLAVDDKMFRSLPVGAIELKLWDELATCELD